MNNFIISSIFILLLLLPTKFFAEQNYIFTGSNALKLVSSALKDAGAGKEIKVFINNLRDEDVIANSTSEITAGTDALEIDKSSKRFTVNLFLKENGRNLAPIKLSGSFDELVEFPILKRQIKYGEIINQDDIDIDKQPSRKIRKNTITDVKEILGKSPKHIISSGRAIRTDEIASPTLIAKGARVTMIYKTKNIEIKTTGEAIDSGSKGDVIKLRNLTSKQIISGIVESSERVKVSSPDSDIAAEGL
ncbi:MAG: flagellar basal body P-ring formation chaperone FlgA [Pseudomonadota bacterium]